ncbi:MAG: indole-3-glycerol phosphate synthase TrpC [Chthoniobacterales bacterium]|nr:MAG: indole-3-glycerol phosphate synthase TrpC [Chthoniobacterales bacterium]
MSILEEIVASRRAHLAASRTAAHAATLARAAEQMRAIAIPHRLRSALIRDNCVNIIGEYKRGSPSAGVINEIADPADVAAKYESAGACAISVVTESRFFGGSLRDLRLIRSTSSLPILRKDFIVDEYQINEAVVAGADAVLLIVAALSNQELRRLHARAEELAVDALVEVHTREELDRALSCGSKLLGVNNRDLHTFVTSIDTSIELAPFAPADVTLVSESGISRASQIAQLLRCGFRGFLIGESLMRSPDPGELIRSFQCAANEGWPHA